MLDIIKNFAVNENKKDGSREQQPIKIHNKGHNDDIMTELLQIDQLHHQFQKLKDQRNISADTPGILFWCEPDLLWTKTKWIRYKLEFAPELEMTRTRASQMKKNWDSKTEITVHDDPSNKSKDSVHVEEVVHKESGDSLIFSDQVSNTDIIIATMI